MQLKANYHTHTYRCGHAVDTEDEYCLAAISLGLDTLGFSDHVPFKGLHFPNMRQDYEMLDGYVQTLQTLREKYKGQLSIHIGYEAEYVEEYLDEYRLMLSSQGIEYLICGQHCFLHNGQQVWYNASHHSEEMVSLYAEAVIKAMKSRLFTYIAHPDHFMNGYQVWDDFAEKISRKILEQASLCQIPLEINVAGLRFSQYKHRKNGVGKPVENLYPYDRFWQLAADYDIVGIIGIDAHSKNDFLDGIEKEALEFANNFNIRLIDNSKFQNPFK